VYLRENIKKPSYILIFVSLMVWTAYMHYTNSFYLFLDNWPISLTMLFGSFIAGASSEGGGAIAFPVFTLVFELTPTIARNFSFAIQSVGMTAASLIILDRKIKIEKKAIIFSSIGGLLGLYFGTFFILELIEPKLIKLLFVSLWLSFGVVLFIKNNILKIVSNSDELKVSNYEILFLIFFGFIGGIVSSVFGNGLDMVIFCFLTLYFKLEEKIATPTSVIIMAINTVCGFVLHHLIVKDISPLVFDYWLVSIPIVILFAPLGAIIINKFKTESIAKFLIFIVLIQFLGAIIILRPGLKILLYCFAVVSFGTTVFLLLLKNRKHRRVLKPKI